MKRHTIPRGYCRFSHRHLLVEHHQVLPVSMNSAGDFDFNARDLSIYDHLITTNFSRLFNLPAEQIPSAISSQTDLSPYFGSDRNIFSSINPNCAQRMYVCRAETNKWPMRKP